MLWCGTLFLHENKMRQRILQACSLKHNIKKDMFSAVAKMNLFGSGSPPPSPPPLASHMHSMEISCKYSMSRLEHTFLQDCKLFLILFFSIWVFLQITGLQGKGEGLSLSPHYHFYPLYRHLDISREITAES